MAVWDEGLGGNLITASALVAGAFVLLRLAPLPGPGIGSLVVSGLQLFAEAEFEIQDGMIGKLAEQVVAQPFKTMPADGTEQEPRASREAASADTLGGHRSSKSS